MKVQDRVLEALEKKHSSELSILMKLSADADDLDNVEQGLYINNVVCCVTLYKLSVFVGMKTQSLRVAQELKPMQNCSVPIDGNMKSYVCYLQANVFFSE